MSPIEALYARPPPPFPAYEAGYAIAEELDEQLLSRDEVIHELKAHLATAINKIK